MFIQSNFYLFFFFLISPVFFSCESSAKSEQSTEQTIAASNYDSLKAQKIESIINEINEGVKLQGLPFQLPFPTYNTNDTIEYWLVNNEPARISVNLVYPEKVVWPTFFVKNNELVFVRYRIWVQDFPPFAREKLVYLEDGKIVYCKERSIDLAPGGLPAELRNKPFSICSKPEKEIKEDYENYWEKSREFIAQNRK